MRPSPQENMSSHHFNHLPAYAFDLDLQSEFGNDGTKHLVPYFDGNLPRNGFDFDATLRKSWNDAMRAGVFNYSLDTRTKTLPGKFGLVAQLNINRGIKRRSPFQFSHLNEPFDHEKFNYTKIKPEEVLARVYSRSDNIREPNGLSNLTNGEAFESSFSYIIINTSPIEIGHSLLVPFLEQCLPQALTEDALGLALRIAQVSLSKSFHLVYNSLLAHASINHLHFHLYYLDEFSLMLQQATIPMRQVLPPRETIFIIEDWLVPGYVMQCHHHQPLQQFTAAVFKVIATFQRLEIAHNLFITKAQAYGPPAEGVQDEKSWFLTVFLFPRQSVIGAKVSNAFSPAACELGGHVLVYDEEFYENLSEEEVAKICRETAALPKDQFDRLTETITNEPSP